jgi:hypothetical protein
VAAMLISSLRPCTHVRHTVLEMRNPRTSLLRVIVARLPSEIRIEVDCVVCSKCFENLGAYAMHTTIIITENTIIVPAMVRRVRSTSICPAHHPATGRVRFLSRENDGLESFKLDTNHEVDLLVLSALSLNDDCEEAERSGREGSYRKLSSS